MKTWNEIDVKQPLSVEDFLTLFVHLPLNEEEKAELNVYFEMYNTFVKSEVEPENAWVAVRNIYALKNQHLIERIAVRNKIENV